MPEPTIDDLKDLLMVCPLLSTTTCNVAEKQWVRTVRGLFPADPPPVDSMNMERELHATIRKALEPLLNRYMDSQLLHDAWKCMSEVLAQYVANRLIDRGDCHANSAGHYLRITYGLVHLDGATVTRSFNYP